MDDKTIVKLKGRLLGLKAKLNGDIDHIENNALNNPEHSYGIDKIGELGSDNFEQDMSLTQMKSEQDTLKKVNSALERIEKNDGKDFGLCEKCQKQISMDRLNAIPYATLCIQCQLEEEKS